MLGLKLAEVQRLQHLKRLFFITVHPFLRHAPSHSFTTTVVVASSWRIDVKVVSEAAIHYVMKHCGQMMLFFWHVLLPLTHPLLFVCERTEVINMTSDHRDQARKSSRKKGNLEKE